MYQNATYRSYMTKSGQHILTTQNLDYALSRQLDLRLDAVHPADMDSIHFVLPYGPLSCAVQALCSYPYIAKSKDLLEDATTELAQAPQHYIVMDDSGDVCIRIGAEYVKLDDYIAHASKASLAMMLRAVAVQDCVSQLLLYRAQSEETEQNQCKDEHI